MFRSKQFSYLSSLQPKVLQDELKPYFDLWSMAIDYNGSAPKSTKT